MRLSVCDAVVHCRFTSGAHTVERKQDQRTSFRHVTARQYSAQMARVARRGLSTHVLFHTDVLCLVEQWRYVQEITNTTARSPR